MKRNQLLVLSLLALGVQAISTGSALAEVTARGDIVETMPFPMDGDGPFNLPAIESFAERHADLGRNSEPWGVGRREVERHDPFPFGGCPVDD